MKSACHSPFVGTRRGSVIRRVAGWLIALPFLFLAGCGGCGGGVGSVEGEVTVHDKLVPEGTIAFFPQEANNEILVSPIKDGRYFVEKVPRGKAIIVVMTKEPAMVPKQTKGRKKKSAPPPPVKAGGPDGSVTAPKVDESEMELPPGYVGVNRRYGEPTTSGLELNIVGGKQTHNLKLDP